MFFITFLFSSVFLSPLFSLSLLFPYTYVRNPSLVRKDQIRIIPVETGAADKEWEDECESIGKQLIEDFLEESRKNWQVAHRGKRNLDLEMEFGLRELTPSQELVPKSFYHHPQQQNINDRQKGRRKSSGQRLQKVSNGSAQKRIPGVRTAKTQNVDSTKDVIWSSSSLKSNDEPIISFYPVLRPYKNGLLVKSGKQTYNAEQKDVIQIKICPQPVDKKPNLMGHSSSLDTLEEYDSSASDGQLSSPISGDELEELALLSQTWGGPSLFYSNAFTLNSLSSGSSDLKPGHYKNNGKYGCSMHSLKLSPVEEPSEEYVDTMDELQCLVESVSEYLAEKEEEINRFHTLPVTNVSSSVVAKKQNLEHKVEDMTNDLNKGSPSNEMKAEPLPDLSGIKNTVNSFFSSFTQKVGSGAKHITTSVEKIVSSAPEKPQLPKTGGISKIFNIRLGTNDVKKSTSENFGQKFNFFGGFDAPGPVNRNKESFQSQPNLAHSVQLADSLPLPQCAQDNVFGDPQKVFSEECASAPNDPVCLLDKPSFDKADLSSESNKINAVDVKIDSSNDQQVDEVNKLNTSDVAGAHVNSIEQISSLPKSDEIVKPVNVVNGNDPKSVAPIDSNVSEAGKRSESEFFHPLKKSFSQFFFQSSDSSTSITGSMENARSFQSETDIHNKTFGLDKIKIPFFSSFSLGGKKDSESSTAVPELPRMASSENVFSSDGISKMANKELKSVENDNEGKPLGEIFVEDSLQSNKKQPLTKCDNLEAKMIFHQQEDRQKCSTSPIIQKTVQNSEMAHRQKNPVKDIPNMCPSAGESKENSKGFISRLFRFSSTDNLTATKETFVKERESSQDKKSGGFFSGLFKVASCDNLTSVKPNPVSFVGPQQKVSVDSRDQGDGGGSSEEQSGVLSKLKQFLPVQKENECNVKRLTKQDLEGRHCGDDVSTTQHLRTLKCRSRDVSVQFDSEAEDLGLCWMDDFENGIYPCDGPTLHRNTAIEETRSFSSYEWEYDVPDWYAELPVKEAYACYAHVNAEANDMILSPTLHDTVINLCKKDQNENDWISFLTLEEGDLNTRDYSFTVASYKQEIDFSLTQNDASSLNDGLPLDLSYSSQCDHALWSLIDHDSLIFNDNAMFCLENDEYMEWLALLEFGLWWQSEDGDCGYYMYSDGYYVYSLLTDPTGEYVYVCEPDAEIYEDFIEPDYLIMDDIIVCGFKVPFGSGELPCFFEDQMFESHSLNSPLDFSLPRSDQLMNLNLETFSHMFEESIHCQRDQPVDFSTRKLRKLKVDLRSDSEGVFLDRQSLDLSMCPQWHSSSMQGNAKPLSSGTSEAHRVSHSFPNHAEESTLTTEKSSEKSELKKALFNPVSSLFSSLGGLLTKNEDTKPPTSTSEGRSPVLNDIAGSGNQNSVNEKPLHPSQEDYIHYPEKGRRDKSHRESSTFRNVHSSRINSEKTQASVHVMREKPVLDQSPLQIQGNVTKLDQQQDRPLSHDAKVPHSNEPEKTLLKSALEIFNINDGSKTSTDKSTTSGFFNFFKTQSDTSELTSLKTQEQLKSSAPESPDKTKEKAVSGAKESGGISSIFGSITDLFKAETVAGKPSSDVIPTTADTKISSKPAEHDVKESPSISSMFGSISDLFKSEPLTGKPSSDVAPHSDEIKLSNKPADHEMKDSLGISSIFGSLSDLFKAETAKPSRDVTPSPSADFKSVGKPVEVDKEGARAFVSESSRHKVLRKQETFIDCSQSTSVEEELGVCDRETVFAQSQIKFPKKVVKETHQPLSEQGVSPALPPQEQVKPLFGSIGQSSMGCGEKTQPHLAYSNQAANVSEPTVQPQKKPEQPSIPILPTSQIADSLSQTASSIFSFFSRPEKVETSLVPEQKTPQAKEQESQGFFKLPSFFSSEKPNVTPAQKVPEQNNNTFSSFFGFSLFDEKKPTAPAMSSSNKAPETPLSFEGGQRKNLKNNATMSNKEYSNDGLPQVQFNNIVVSDHCECKESPATYSRDDQVLGTNSEGDQLSEQYHQDEDSVPESGKYLEDSVLEPCESKDLSETEVWRNVDAKMQPLYEDGYQFGTDDRNIPEAEAIKGVGGEREACYDVLPAVDAEIPVDASADDGICYSENTMIDAEAGLDNDTWNDACSENIIEAPCSDTGVVLSEDRDQNIYQKEYMDSFIDGLDNTGSVISEQESNVLEEPQSSLSGKENLEPPIDDIPDSNIESTNTCLQKAAQFSQGEEFSQGSVYPPQQPKENIPLPKPTDHSFSANTSKDYEQDKSVFDSSVEMFSSFMSKMNVFSGNSSEPQKNPPSFGFTSQAASSTFSKKSSFFGFPSPPQASTFSNDFFGLFKSSPEVPSKMSGAAQPANRDDRILKTQIKLDSNLTKSDGMCQNDSGHLNNNEGGKGIVCENGKQIEMAADSSMSMEMEDVSKQYANRGLEPENKSSDIDIEEPKAHHRDQMHDVTLSIDAAVLSVNKEVDKSLEPAKMECSVFLTTSLQKDSERSKTGEDMTSMAPILKSEAENLNEVQMRDTSGILQNISPEVGVDSSSSPAMLQVKEDAVSLCSISFDSSSPVVSNVPEKQQSKDQFDMPRLSPTPSSHLEAASRSLEITSASSFDDQDPFEMKTCSGVSSSRVFTPPYAERPKPKLKNLMHRPVDRT